MISHDIPWYPIIPIIHHGFLQDFRMTPVPRGTSCSCAKVAKPLRRLRWWDCHSDGGWGYSWCIYYILYTIYIYTIYIYTLYIYIYIHYIYIYTIYIHYIYIDILYMSYLQNSIAQNGISMFPSLRKEANRNRHRKGMKATRENR